MLFLIVFFRFMVSFSPILGGGRFPANQRRMVLFISGEPDEFSDDGGLQWSMWVGIEA